MSKRELNGAPMLPFALAACENAGEELRVTNLSAEGFAVRSRDEITSFSDLTLSFYHGCSGTYHQVKLTSYSVETGEVTRFYREYRIFTEQPEYRQEAERLFREYRQYISLKMTGDDGYLAQELTGYPWELEEEYYTTFAEQKRAWMQDVCEGAAGEQFPAALELAVCLDNDRQRKSYLNLDKNAFAKTYWEENFLSSHPIARQPFRRIYVGNQFCENLFPSEKELFAILEKASAQEQSVTVMFAPAQEHQISQRERVTGQLAKWCLRCGKRMEAVVNDWGMAALLREQGSVLEPVLGVLLNRRRKDVRYQYKIGLADSEAYPPEGYGSIQQHGFQELAATGLNSAFYQEYLHRTFGITRYEFESCGYMQEIPPGAHSLHLPFYQTNTSQYCPLYAECREGSRGRQRFAADCPQYCRSHAFLYPKHLALVGRYNSMFGFDCSILRNMQILEKYAHAGVDRVVVGMI